MFDRFFDVTQNEENYFAGAQRETLFGAAGDLEHAIRWNHATEGRARETRSLGDCCGHMVYQFCARQNEFQCSKLVYDISARVLGGEDIPEIGEITLHPSWALLNVSFTS